MQNKAQCLVSIFCRVQIGELSVHKGRGGGGYPQFRQIFRQTSSVVYRVEDE